MIRLRIFLLFLAVVTGFVMTAGAADASPLHTMTGDTYGAAPDTGPGFPVLSPMNPEFIAYRNRTTALYGAVSSPGGTEIVFSDGSVSRIFPDGEIPSPVDFSYTRTLTEKTAMLTDAAYPVVYDLRTLGKVTPVKDQGSAGSCWAFATYGSLESSFLKGETWDFSENNMKNILAGTYAGGFDRTWAGGGNRFMSTAYLARWSGPVPEAADPYSDSSGYSPAGLHTVRHVQDVQFLPERAAPDQTSHIKNALTSTGAVQASIYYDAAYYNPSGAAFYNPDHPTTNHAITIVGWNDAYSRSNFTIPPPGNGAWIVKNSWGTGWGNSGYFYVSYYDRNIGDRCAVFTGKPATIYDRVYSYDPLGWVISLGFDNSTSAMYANVFTARSAETLNAIGLYDTSAGSYTARIYLDPAGGPVNASGPVAEVSWTDSMPAYRTLKIPPVTLRKGQKFSIVVNASTPDNGFPVALEYPLEDYASHARAQAGQGYISETGSAWTDMTTVLPDTSICLKGYTTLRTKVGVFRPSTRTFYLNNGTINKTAFGAATDIPVTGDWNGDGLWDVGVYRNATHRFLLKNGSVLTVINIGQAMDIPVTGDWNGDGLWDVGVFNASAKQFLLKNGTQITTVIFGSVTDIPVTGDWNGDGLWDVGVYRNASRTFLLRNGPRNTTMVVYGYPTDTPVTGDWNGDGFWDVGVFRPAAHRFLLKSGSMNMTTLWGIAGDKPVTGKWS